MDYSNWKKKKLIKRLIEFELTAKDLRSIRTDLSMGNAFLRDANEDLRKRVNILNADYHDLLLKNEALVKEVKGRDFYAEDKA